MSNPHFQRNDHAEHWHAEHDHALTSLMQSVGVEIAGELVKGKPSVVDEVVRQEHEGVKPNDFNLKALGATAEQIARIEAFRAKRADVKEDAIANRQEPHFTMRAGADEVIHGGHTAQVTASRVPGDRITR